MKLNKIKVFKNAKWDSDAASEELIQELFRKKERTKIAKKVEKRLKGKKEKMELFVKRGLQKPPKDFETLRLIQSPQYKEKITKITERQLKKIKQSKTHNGVGSSGSNDEENAKKLIQKYKNEVDDLNKKSVNLKVEMLQEKERQKKLQLMVEILKRRTAQKLAETPATRDFKKKEETSKANPNQLLAYTSAKLKRKFMFQERLRENLKQAVPKKPSLTLRQKMMEKLKAARFRFLNEQIYTTNSKEAQRIFQSDPDAFEAYHDGYRQQVKSWPMNPLDYIVKSIKKMPKFHIIADFGCGDAELAKSVDQTVHSFDLVAANDSVTACDMAHVPLEDASVEVVVFCLSLMGTNLNDYIQEANRILKAGGTLKIAEVESRFEDVADFVKGLQQFGFRNIWRDLSHNLFYFLDFTKVSGVKNKKKLPNLTLLPCLYKKR